MITRLIEAKYEVMKDNFKASLQAATSYTFTCDNWTDVSNQSYLGVTIHYLSVDNALKSGCLGVIPLDESHTAAYLSKTLVSVIKSFGLSVEDITAVVSDSAANIKKAVMDIFGRTKHLPCFAHILSNMVPNIIASMPDVQNIITKVKNIVVLTKRSVVASDELKRL
ncbi:zinc finger bed domain-containing protein 1-like protein [Lasius niger]|uniref:Zinc finger bed domain-containing protein 1-like protein n=1 Tax=Lasius niger TaxID=67767 RepID=A0A0J7K374_LASNI|nr:zinc finger bed domain-containing protein 1-like protein [Lasius niger]